MSKITKLLAREGATISDIVKTTSYTTDQRQGAGGCETEPDPKAPRPAHTALNVAQLAYPGMLVQLDVTAIVPANRVTTQR
jgi:2-iminobutanoate/2-iminopropanoate deaminase